jgi:hypothetical protein
MAKQYCFLKLEQGETVGHFLSQFKEIQFPEDGIIPWTAIIEYAKLAGEPDSDRKILRLPIVVDRD